MTMVDLAVLPGFVAVILLFLVPPGPDMAYMLAVGLGAGRRAALHAILGIGTGMSVYAAAVVAGVGQVADARPGAFDAVKLGGALYLAWLAVVSLRGARRDVDGPADVPPGRWYLRGLLVSLMNPKIMLFFLAVLPQFTGRAEDTTLQLAMLGAVNVAAEMVLYGGLGVFAGTFHARFSGSVRSRTALSLLASFVYAGLAVVIVAEVLTG